MNIFTLFLFRRMCQNLLISAPDAGTRHFWHTSLAKGIDIRKEIKTDKDMNKKKLIIGIVGVLVVAGGIWFFTGKTSKGGIRLETAKVGRSSISNTVTATGTVEPVTEVEVGTQVSGIIDKLYADYNDVVKAGQLIAEMTMAQPESRTRIRRGTAGKQQKRIRVPTEELRPQQDPLRKKADQRLGL